MKTEPKYRTFDELLNEVSTDFVMYNNEGLIEPAQLIKVAQRVSYDLGVRIHGTKEKVLDDRFETNFVVNEIEPWAEDTSSSQD